MTPAPGIWLTGRPASGKSSIARALRDELRTRGHVTTLLDSDDLRGVLTPEPRYDEAERDWFYGVIADLAARLASDGVVVLVAATAPLQRHRDRARRACERFAEIHVRASLEACRRRDPKGLYRAADAGRIRSLPGVQAPYEAPEHPELALDSDRIGLDEAARRALDMLERRGLLAG